MGMLMHHTWLQEQQKKTADEPVKEKETVTVEVTEKNEPESAPLKRGGRRKTSNK